ncbi:MAG TPA: glycerol-3-phosphate dehydrogenase/oxidase [Terriglobales bacterium]|nr:glycerol-3-phosphate dehydrogenase/oxidase [Terriglobales bacterium]
MASSINLMLSSLDGRHFDIVIVGGGINGSAIARECARHGKSILLVEQNDFSSGTTSRATRIIHGGLRYLEHGEVSLVRESLRERELLLKEKPHLVRPLNFLLALPEGGERKALEVRFGLWLYRRFANRPAVHAATSDKRTLEGLLDSGQLWSVFAYEDAQCEFPERLVVEWLVEAAQNRAVIRNYCELLSAETANGKITGARLRDRLNDHEIGVTCSWLINATGPWADSICQRSNIATDEPMIGGLRGSHILLPTFPGAPHSAVYTEAIDRRPIFVIPWAGQLLVGTTEVKDTDDPGRVQPSSDEITYLMRSFQRLFPSVDYRFSDIRAAFAGVRPLPFVSDRSPDAITRSHVLIDHAFDGAEDMISIIGGKLTTAASLAREVARAIGIKVPELRGYGVRDITHANELMCSFQREVEQRAQISPEFAAAIVKFFGSHALAVADLAATDDRLRQPICPHTKHIVAEAVHAFRNEFAESLSDILLRRVPVAFSPCWSEDCSKAAAQKIGSALAWDSHRIAREQDSFEKEYASFLAKPSLSV